LLAQKPNSYSVPLYWALACVWIAGLCGCQRNVRQPVTASETPTPLEAFQEQFPGSEEGSSLGFEVHWPPINPNRESANPRSALLDGQLLVLPGGGESQELKMRILIELNRPTSDEARLRWNQQLKFPEYLWMARLRVWDKDRQWLWPNVSCLLTAYGVERVERYGGIDPEKKVDNDFAGIVVRSYDDQGNEFDESIDQPLISARWHPGSTGPTITNTSISSVVHSAKSDLLQISIPDFQLAPSNQPNDSTLTASGQIRVWLIYADFMYAEVPAAWPQEKEFSGGILSYFVIDWEKTGNKIEIQSVTNQVPPSASGIDWQTWCEAGKLSKLKSDTIFE